jgi:hypothetical protein
MEKPLKRAKDKSALPILVQLIGVACLLAGVYLVAGIGIALITAGLLLAASGTLREAGLI